MEKSDFAENTIDLLCEYVGEDRVFDALIRRWGIEPTFNVISNLMEKKKSIDEKGDSEVD